MRLRFVADQERLVFYDAKSGQAFGPVVTVNPDGRLFEAKEYGEVFVIWAFAITWENITENLVKFDTWLKELPESMDQYHEFLHAANGQFKCVYCGDFTATDPGRMCERCGPREAKFAAQSEAGEL